MRRSRKALGGGWRERGSCVRGGNLGGYLGRGWKERGELPVCILGSVNNSRPLITGELGVLINTEVGGEKEKKLENLIFNFYFLFYRCQESSYSLCGLQSE